MGRQESSRQEGSKFPGEKRASFMVGREQVPGGK